MPVPGAMSIAHLGLVIGQFAVEEYSHSSMLQMKAFLLCRIVDDEVFAFLPAMVHFAEHAND
ncbi:uncharacterized protein BCR38DRAFT_419221 [Pseudomassariella vexata]|uniref:Uncharacterized protein n=1 Tax=Pseudomassariella vexata TaxID=1141098 RepID=A0A1Y2ED22_9PEZI|nr:uncharacterized protein BCR38DRAFT_419221 [Pseudomassariella vexata]ORY69471.1 hypothetical protein BCR38DRAFT_419221 [Pseudomassariella vexata]